MLEEFFGDDQEWVNKISEAIRTDAAAQIRFMEGKLEESTVNLGEKMAELGQFRLR